MHLQTPSPALSDQEAGQKLKDEARRAYHKKYREDHKIEFLAYGQKYRENTREQIRARAKIAWITTERFKSRMKRMGNRRCPFCAILIAANSIKGRARKYCDTCRRDPKIKSQIRSLYTKRAWDRYKNRPERGLDFPVPKP